MSGNWLVLEDSFKGGVTVKEILVKVMNEKANAYKDQGYNCINASLNTVKYTAELALESGILSYADYAEVINEYARLYKEAFEKEKDRLYREVLKEV